jgi:hypothetical protein
VVELYRGRCPDCGVEHILARGVLDIFLPVRALRQSVEGEEVVASIRTLFATGADEMG